MIVADVLLISWNIPAYSRLTFYVNERFIWNICKKIMRFFWIYLKGQFIFIFGRTLIWNGHLALTAYLTFSYNFQYTPIFYLWYSNFISILYIRIFAIHENWSSCNIIQKQLWYNCNCLFKKQNIFSSYTYVWCRIAKTTQD